MEKRIILATILVSLMSLGLQAYDSAGVTESATKAFKEQAPTGYNPASTRAPLTTTGYKPALTEAPPSTTTGYKPALTQAPPSTTTGYKPTVTQAPPSTTAAQPTNTVDSARQAAAQQTGRTGRFGFF